VPVTAIAAVTRWNLLATQLVGHVLRVDMAAQPPFSFATPKMLQMWLRLWSKLAADDPRNVPVERAAAFLRLSTAHLALLESANVRTVKDLGQILLAASSVERVNGVVRELARQFDDRERCRLDVKPLTPPLTSRDAEAIVDAIAVALEPASARRPGPGKPDYSRGSRPRGRRGKRR
jgi:hypothetical protein